MLYINFDLFRRQLRLTQQYCEQQLVNTYKNNASILRSINPEYNGRNIFEFILFNYGYHNNYCYGTKWGVDPYDNDHLLGELFHSQLGHKQQVITSMDADTSIKGDIFVFSVDETLIDGAATVESLGFLDDYNCPPIDTWFYLTASEKGSLLLAWVPEQFEAVVNGGIDVNPENCIDWFKKWYPSEYTQIVRSGIIKII